MSTDESTIAFPVDKFKAETLRLMAKDLGVIPGGKKDELLGRLRASSASGWVTPAKRKSDLGPFKSPPTTTKKSKILRTPRGNNPSATVVEVSSPTRRSTRRNKHAAVPEISPQQGQLEHPSNQEEVPNGENPQDSDQITPGVFDDYLTSDSTNVFITGDDLLTMVDEVPAPKVLTLWKVTSRLSELDPSPSWRVDHWLIPANEGDKIQNLATFKEVYNDVFEKLRGLKIATPISNGTSNGVGNKDHATTPAGPSKPRWFEVSVSRNLGNGALAVKLIKGTVKGKVIVPIKDAKEEDGTFWLSEPIAAKDDDSALLDQSMKL